MAPLCRSLKCDSAPLTPGFTGRDGLDQFTPLPVPNQDKGIAEPNPDNEFYELDFKNSRRTKLGHLVTKKGDVFRYEYDFGDGWDHMLLVEDILEYDPSVRYSLCLTGKRACPPEDCGGTRGYAELLEIIRDPDHEEYLDMMTWLGDHFDPDSFDVTIVNQKLRSMRLR